MTGDVDGIIDALKRASRKYLTIKWLISVSFYLVAAMIILSLLLMIFSIIYINSVNPLDMFSLPIADFSYCGSPVALSLVSDSNNSISCESLDEVSVLLSGSSILQLNPCYFNRTIMFIGRNGTVHSISGPVTLISPPGSIVSINTNTSGAIGRTYFRLDFVNASIDLQRNTNKYLMALYSDAGSPKSYNTDVGISDDRTGASVNNINTITVYNGTLGIGDPSNSFVGTVVFRGDLRAATSDILNARFFTGDVKNLLARSSAISWADGSLLISKKHYVCSGADNITIDASRVTEYPIGFQLSNGKCTLTGTANSIMLRYQEYLRQPIKMLLRDNYLTFLFTMLIGIITLSLRRLTHLIKGK